VTWPTKQLGPFFVPPEHEEDPADVLSVYSTAASSMVDGGSEESWVTANEGQGEVTNPMGGELSHQWKELGRQHERIRCARERLVARGVVLNDEFPTLEGLLEAVQIYDQPSALIWMLSGAIEERVNEISRLTRENIELSFGV
jgi:hypothetical protein